MDFGYDRVRQVGLPLNFLLEADLQLFPDLCLREFCKVFQGCFKEVLGVFRETFKGDSRELLGI